MHPWFRRAPDPKASFCPLLRGSAPEHCCRKPDPADIVLALSPSATKQHYCALMRSSGPDPFRRDVMLQPVWPSSELPEQSVCAHLASLVNASRYGHDRFGGDTREWGQPPAHFLQPSFSDAHRRGRDSAFSTSKFASGVLLFPGCVLARHGRLNDN